MADLDAITTPLTAALAALTADGRPADAVYLWDPDWNQPPYPRCWYVNVGEREIERHTGRYRESITFICIYGVGDAGSHRSARRVEAAAMMQAAIVAFNSPAAMVLGDGAIVAAVDPVKTAGGWEMNGSVWVASQINLTVSRWVRYSE